MPVSPPERILNHDSRFDGQLSRPRLLFQIEVEAVEDEQKSLRHGRKCYTDRTFLAWTKVGAYNMATTRAEVEPRNRVARDYSDVWEICGGREFFERWKANSSSVDEIDGTPLRMWPLVTPAQIKEFEYCNVRSVEDLSSLTDANISRFGPGTRVLVQKAKKWLEESERAGKIVEANAALQSRLDDQAETITQQKADIQELQAALKQLSSERQPSRAAKQ